MPFADVKVQSDRSGNILAQIHIEHRQILQVIAVIKVLQRFLKVSPVGITVIEEGMDILGAAWNVINGLFRKELSRISHRILHCLAVILAIIHKMGKGLQEQEGLPQHQYPLPQFIVYLQVGYYIEIYFPQKNVRFIAVNDGVDSTVESSNDFNPIRNWANELHAKDTSRKVRAVMKMKAEQGERLGGRPPYGYRKSDGDANTLVPDEDTAPVVKHIFSLCAAGNGPKRIATILTKEQVVNPSNAYYRKTGKSHRGLDTTRPCLWSSNSVTSILNNEVYLGHSVGLRTTTISYKNKQRVERPESERFVVKNTHEALVTQEQWDIVQEVRQHKKRVPKHMDEPNIFSGLVFCADCGKPLVLHRASTMKRTEYNFKCYTYGKKGKTVCTPHHIREFELKAVVLEDLRRVTHFARMKEKQFAAYIGSKNTLELRREMNTIQKDLDTMRRR